MTENKCKRKWINLQEICKEDTDSLKELLREVLQEVLEQEMTETLKAEKGELKELKKLQLSLVA